MTTTLAALFNPVVAMLFPFSLGLALMACFAKALRLFEFRVQRAALCCCSEIGTPVIVGNEMLAVIWVSNPGPLFGFRSIRHAGQSAGRLVFHCRVARRV